MAKIVLISCVSKKQDKEAKAKDIYTSALFKYSLKYAQKFKPKKMFILSAKYGLLDLDKKIKPYNKTLGNMKANERKEWADRVISQLENLTNLNEDEFILLAGKKYIEYLLPHLSNNKNPLEGMGIGKRLGYLKRHTQ